MKEYVHMVEVKKMQGPLPVMFTKITEHIRKVIISSSELPKNWKKVLKKWGVNSPRKNEIKFVKVFYVNYYENINVIVSFV